ncbi:hypothetical protein HK104_004292 [Borealophlyctis nickersoniae]|nr:hypothetical protein HK104_004292 [Borealophlyctis nickersoniae]
MDGVLRDPLQAQCRSIAGAIAQQMHEPLYALYSMRWFFASSPNVTNQSYQQFFSSFNMQEWTIPWVAYAPRVSDVDRPAWEASTSHIITQDASIDNVTQPLWSPQSVNFIPRRTASLYFPIQLVPAGFERYLGFDLLSDSFGIKGVNSPDISLSNFVYQELNGTLTPVQRFILPYPEASNTTTTTAMPQGLFTGVLYSTPLIDSAINSTVGDSGMVVRVYDPMNNTLIYAFPSNGTIEGTDLGSYPFTVADRTWIVSCTGKRINSPDPWIVFALILLFFTSLAILTRLLIRAWQNPFRGITLANTTKIRAGREGDQEWMRSNAAAILAAMRDPLFLFDSNGYVVDANEEARSLSKYGTEDFGRGVHISQIFPTVEQKKGGKNGRKSGLAPAPWVNSAVQSQTSLSPSTSSQSPSAAANPSQNAPTGASPRRDETVVDMSDGTLNVPEWHGFAHGLQEVAMRCNDGRSLDVEANFSEVIECESLGDRIQAVVVRDCSGYKAAMKDMLEGKESAEVANMEKSNFLAFVFHELRNPLHAVIGLNALLIQSLATAMDPTNPVRSASSPTLGGTAAPTPSQNSQLSHQEAMEYLASISDAARMMRVIVNDMRVLSKLEAGTVELERNLFNLQQLVETVYRNQLAAQDEMIASGETMGGNFGGQMVEIRMQLKGLETPSEEGMGDGMASAGVGLGLQEKIPGMPGKEWYPLKLRGDATRIQQILSNIVSNSLKHTKQGTVTIRCHVEKIRELDSSGRERQVVFGPDSISGTGGTTKQCCVRFEVEDTGKGIPRSEVPKLFKTYSQSAFSAY